MMAKYDALNSYARTWTVQLITPFGRMQPPRGIIVCDGDDLKQVFQAFERRFDLPELTIGTLVTSHGEYTRFSSKYAFWKCFNPNDNFKIKLLGWIYY